LHHSQSGVVEIDDAAGLIDIRPSELASCEQNPKEIFMNMKSMLKTVLLAAVALTADTGLCAAEPPASLKAAYGKWFDVGTALGPRLTEAEEQLLASQFTTFTSENCLKPAMIHPRENQFSFQQGDALVALAEKHHLKLNAHTLVWHESCPDWFFQDQGKPAGRELVLKRLQEHIATVAGRYSGKVASWDVVNEAISDKPGEYLRESKWKMALGEDFILEAFLAAQKADPKAELVYNDFGIEQPAKRQKTLRLIRELRERGARLDGVGIQGHWASGRVPLQQIEESIVAFHQAGVKVMITELDLDVVPRKNQGADVSQTEKGTDDPYANGCPPEVLQRQAADYAALFKLFRKHADKVSRVTFWNLHDGRSWLNTWPRRRTNYPLLWDRQLQPKPAFDAVMAVAREPVSTKP
jgi:endo-1,4-beta-xylanase